MSAFEGIFSRIKRATNTRTQVEVAEVLEIRQSSISDAKRRDSVPSDWYMKLFEKFGLNPDWLKYGSGPMYLKSESGYEPFDAPGAAGVAEDPARYAEPEGKSRVAVVYSMQCDQGADECQKPRNVGKIALSQALAGNAVMVFKMEAANMEPTIRKGAFVGVDTSLKNIVSGEVYAVFIPNEGVALKRLFHDVEKSRFILRSENPMHPEQHLPVDKRSDFIIGKAVWVQQTL